MLVPWKRDNSLPNSRAGLTASVLDVANQYEIVLLDNLQYMYVVQVIQYIDVLIQVGYLSHETSSLVCI